MSFNETTEQYRQWLEQERVVFLKQTQICDLRSKHEGRGVIAQVDIAEGEQIFSIPRSIILNVENCRLVEDKPEVKDTLLQLNQWEALIVILLYETKVISDSKWTPYFNVLPIKDTENYQFNQLMFWTDEHKRELEPSLVLQRIGKDLADAMYKKLFPKVIVEEMNIQGLANTTLEEYHKIASLIMSYSFDVDKLGANGFVQGEDDDDADNEDDDDNHDADDNNNDDNEKGDSDTEHSYPSGSVTAADVSNGDGDMVPNYQDDDIPLSDEEFPDGCKRDTFFKSMIPLADTLNADTNLHNASLQYEGAALVVRAIKPIKKGDQIYNTYSEHPNSEILRRYGYVEIFGSKHDFGEVPLSLIREYFSTCETPLSNGFFDEIVVHFKHLTQEVDPEDDIVEFVLDSYDCFVTSEVIIELIIVLQCLTIISSINSVNSMEALTPDSKYQLIKRIYKKCIQLIESKKLTKNLLVNYKRIIRLRLNQYPPLASDDFTADFKYNRKSMAKIVLQSEYKSLTNCLDIDKTFTLADFKYQFIDDDKLIRNIVKRKFDWIEPTNGKKKTNH